MKKKRKPRTKKQWWGFGRLCDYFDGMSDDGRPVTECFEPWSHRCTGERHKCIKLRLQWLASLSRKNRKSALEKLEKYGTAY